MALPHIKMHNHPQLASIESLAAALGETQDSLLSYIYSKQIKYYLFEIPKSNGGTRIIEAPTRRLKQIQQNIANILCTIYKPSSAVHGYVTQRDIVTNANAHTNKCFVINIDISDFFRTITFARIRGLLSSNMYRIPVNVATVIAHSCCHMKHLATGAPSSPILSNMVASILDAQIIQLARRHNLYYTRYADDITLSSKHYIKLDSIISKIAGTNLWSGELVKVVESSGFAVNHDKIRIQHKTQRQVVTGLVVNQMLNKPRKYVNKIRMLLHCCEKFGIPSANRKYQKLIGSQQTSLLKHLEGLLAHLHHVKGRNDKVYCSLMKRYAKLVRFNYDCCSSKPDCALGSIFIVCDIEKNFIGTAFNTKEYGLVTCNHVADEACFVRHWEDSEYYKAIKIQGNQGSDIALLAVAQLDVAKFTSLKIYAGKRKDLQDPFTFAGFPNYNEEDTPTLISGKIIGISKRGQHAHYKLDQLVFGGASGAPLLDQENMVAGIVVRGMGSEGKFHETDANLAVCIEYIQQLIPD